MESLLVFRNRSTQELCRVKYVKLYTKNQAAPDKDAIYAVQSRAWTKSGKKVSLFSPGMESKTVDEPLERAIANKIPLRVHLQPSRSVLTNRDATTAYSPDKIIEWVTAGAYMSASEDILKLHFISGEYEFVKMEDVRPMTQSSLLNWQGIDTNDDEPTVKEIDETRSDSDFITSKDINNLEDPVLVVSNTLTPTIVKVNYAENGKVVSTLDMFGSENADVLYIMLKNTEDLTKYIDESTYMTIVLPASDKKFRPNQSKYRYHDDFIKEQRVRDQPSVDGNAKQDQNWDTASIATTMTTGSGQHWQGDVDRVIAQVATKYRTEPFEYDVLPALQSDIEFGCFYNSLATVLGDKTPKMVYDDMLAMLAEHIGDEDQARQMLSTGDDSIGGFPFEAIHTLMRRKGKLWTLKMVLISTSGKHYIKLGSGPKRIAIEYNVGVHYSPIKERIRTAPSIEPVRVLQPPVIPRKVEHDMRTEPDNAPTSVKTSADFNCKVDDISRFNIDDTVRASNKIESMSLYESKVSSDPFVRTSCVAYLQFVHKLKSKNLPILYITPHSMRTEETFDPVTKVRHALTPDGSLAMMWMPTLDAVEKTVTKEQFDIYKATIISAAREYNSDDIEYHIFNEEKGFYGFKLRSN
ncbi:hypothetical protein [Biston robustus cypovirus]|nr:hypothetical protein [Biston robustus cypovirus]